MEQILPLCDIITFPSFGCFSFQVSFLGFLQFGCCVASGRDLWTVCVCLTGAATVPGSALSSHPPRRGGVALILYLQVGESFLNASALGWQYYKGLFLVVKPFADLGTPWDRGWGMNSRIQSSVAWFLLLCSSEEGRLRSPIPGACINSEVWPLGWSPGR